MAVEIFVEIVKRKTQVNHKIRGGEKCKHKGESISDCKWTNFISVTKYIRWKERNVLDSVSTSHNLITKKYFYKNTNRKRKLSSQWS